MKTLSTFDIFADEATQNPRNSEGSFVTLKSGRILFIWSCYDGLDWKDNAAANLALAHSDDGGATWVKDGLVVTRTEGVQNIMSVSLLRLASGRILFLYLKKIPNVFGTLDCIPFCKYSDDEAESWSEEIRVAHSANYFVINNDRVIQLSSGRLLVASSIHMPCYNPEGKHGSREGLVCCFYSDDQGEHWYDTPQMLYPPAPPQCYSGWQEPGLIQLEEHKIMMWMRTDLGYQCTCTSTDDGMTWTAPAINRWFPSPCSPMSVKRNPWDNSLVAIFNDTNRRWNVNIPYGNSPRNPLVMAISRDNGETWEERELIDTGEKRGFCYTAMLFDNHKLLLAYCCGLHISQYDSEKGGGAGAWGGRHCLLQDLRIRVLAVD